MTEIQVHPSSTLGSRTVLGAGASVGPNCHVEGPATIGARTVLAGGITLAGAAEIGADCRIEAGVAMTVPDVATTKPLVIGPRARIGAGAILAAGVRIGADAWIEAGTLVLRDVPAHAIVQGNPGTVVGFGGRVRRGADLLPEVSGRRETAAYDCETSGVRLYRFPRFADHRGVLSFGEFGRAIPFTPQRYFFVFDVPAGELRGGHAHLTCQELLFCLGGSVTVAVDDGQVREEIVLDTPDLALCLPSRVWGVQYKYSPGATLVCLASHRYDPHDYIHNYEDYVERMRRS